MGIEKNFDDNLYESFEKFKSFFYNHPEALIFIDKDGFIVEINPKFTEIFGFTLEEIKGKNLNDIFFIPEELSEEGKKLDEIALKTGYINFETKRKRKDGTIIPVSISGSSVTINGKVKGIIGLYIDLSEKKKKEEELKFLSTHDNLTGLYNKQFFSERFIAEKERAKRYGEKFAILFLDLYDFKYINDIYGHSFGDIVLKEIAKKLEQNMRKYDLIARAGGDEFLILITNIKKSECLVKITKRLIDNIFGNLIINDIMIDTGVNIGISIYPDDGEELDELIRKADMAMYHAKSIGKNIFSFYSKELNIESKISEPRKIERKFESIFNNIPIAIIIFDRDKFINFVNDKVVDVLNLKKDEMIGKNIKELINSDLDLKIDEFIENNLDQYSLIKEYKTKEETKFLNLSFFKIFDKDYNTYYYLLSLVDITKEKLLNYELEKEREFLSNLLENIEAIITIEDLDGNVLYINKKGKEILGYEIKDIIGKNWVESFTPENYKDELKRFYENLKKGEIEDLKVHINPIKTKNGTEKVVLWKNSFINYGKNQKALLSLGINITKELELQKELRKKEEILEKILDSSTEIIFVNDIEGKFLYANKTFLDIFNLSKDKVIGKKYIETFPQFEDLIMKLHKKILIEKNQFSTEESITIDGKKYIFDVTISPVLDEKGNIIQIIVFAKDISDLRTKENELENLIDALRYELYFQEKLRVIFLIFHSQENLDKLLEVILDEIEKIIPSSSSNIAFLEKNYLVNVAIRGYEKYGIEDYVKNMKLNIDEFPVEKFVLDTKKPYIIYNTIEEKNWIIFEKTKYIKSRIIVPITVKDKIIGVIRLDSDKENYFSNKDADRLTIIAGSLGLAIENIKNLEKIRSFSEQILNLVSKIIELKDPYTAGHQKNVSDYAIKIAKQMNLSEEKIEVIKVASLLHDIGKMILPFEILNKPFKLTPREYELIKEHPKYGYELLKDINIPDIIKEVILQHHERLNGTGYPKGLKGDEILLETKIIAVADVFDAMNSHRPYRPKYHIKEILNELISNKGTLYDPQVVDVLLELYKENKLI